jgi:hypothetical protein
MKILIVNGYASDYNGQKRFDEFLLIIKEVSIQSLTRGRFSSG